MGETDLIVAGDQSQKTSLKPVAKDLFLHIGSAKTGSTSIQVAAVANRERLARAGFLYPRTLGQRNHIKLTLLAWDGGKTNHLPIAAGLADDSAYQKFKRTAVDDLRREIEKSGCAKVFLCNEHMSSRLKRPEHVTRLAKALRPIAEKVTVVVYLRPQHELLLSSYSTSVKGGITADIQLPKHEWNFRYNYYRMLSLWADAFGDANIIVRIFDRDELVEGDVVRDFFSTIGFAPGTDFEFPPVQNPSLDGTALQFLRAFNAHIPFFLADKFNPDRGDVSRALEALSIGPRFSLSPEVLRSIATMFEISNANVARRFLARLDGVLFKKLNFDRGQAVAPLTVEDAVRFAAHLWRWKHQQVLETREKLPAKKRR